MAENVEALRLILTSVGTAHGLSQESGTSCVIQEACFLRVLQRVADFLVVLECPEQLY